MPSSVSRLFVVAVACAADTFTLCNALCDPNITSVKLIQSRGYDLTGQTHVITGGDAGIGFGIALGLAEANARIIFLGHNMEKTAAAMRNITERTQNDKLSSIPINLMSLASVKSAAAAVLSSTVQIDSLICDAGLVSPLVQIPLTADGFESTLEIEYISHFYLVELLLPELRKTKGRVVHTSTTSIDSFAVCAQSGLPAGCLTIDTLSAVARRPNTVGNGNIFLGLWMKTMHARVLSYKERSNGVSAYSFHPGVVATGDIDQFFKPYGGKDAFLKLCEPSGSPDVFLPGQVEACQNNPAWKDVAGQCSSMKWYECLCSGPDDVRKSCPLSAEQGGVTGTYLAAAPRAELEQVNGAFTVACDYTPVLYGDPYVEMVGKIGVTATRDFLERFHRLSLTWIPEENTRDINTDQMDNHLETLNI